MPGHLLALEHPARISAGTNRPAATEGFVGTVGGAAAFKPVALHDPGKTTALAGAGHIDAVALVKQIGHSYLLADLVFGIGRTPELGQAAEDPARGLHVGG